MECLLKPTVGMEVLAVGAEVVTLHPQPQEVRAIHHPLRHRKEIMAVLVLLLAPVREQVVAVVRLLLEEMEVQIPAQQEEQEPHRLSLVHP